MIRFDRQAEEESDELFQIAAMVDIVFILLAFFVLSVRFQGGECELPMGYRDVSESAGAAARDMPASILVRLSSTEAGGVSIRVGDAVLPNDGFDQLTRLLSDINLPSVPVLIDADDALTVQQVATGMDAILASPMNRLSLSSRDREPKP